MKRPKDSHHHRLCRSNNGGDEPANISMVTAIQHQAWHVLFQNYPPEKIANIINEVWIENSVKMVVRRR